MSWPPAGDVGMVGSGSLAPSPNRHLIIGLPLRFPRPADPDLRYADSINGQNRGPMDPISDLAAMSGGELDEDGRRLEAIELAARGLITSIVPPNTRRAFTQDWGTWVRYCQVEGLDALTVSPGLLVGFVAWLAHDTPDHQSQAPATITRRLAGVLHGWRQAGLEVPHGVTSDARKIIARYERHLKRENLSTGRGQAPALTIRDLRRLAEALPTTLAGIRDRALIVLGFGIAARRSEVASLLVTDIVPSDPGLLVTVRDGKMGGRQLAVLPGTDGMTCPVRTWRAWRHESGLTEGPAFRNIDRHGNLGAALTGASVGSIVTRAGVRAGLEIRLTGHSLRSGLATEARRAGHDAKTIAQQGGWKTNSATLYGYMQIVDKWTDNALAGIGL